MNDITKYKFKLLSFLLIITISVACKNESIRISNTESKTKRDNSITQIESFKITIASGGGFTGLYKGYALHSDGQVVHWQRFGAGQDSTLWTISGTADQILDFKQRLEESGVLSQTFQKTGNMTTVVTLELPDTSYTWLWPGTGVGQKTPDIFKEWYPLDEKYCKTLKNKF